MSEALDQWLEEWGGWLDAVLASGLACPTRETRQRIAHWCDDAELLGFARPAGAARRLFGDDTPMAERGRLLHDLLAEQDMLSRSYQLMKLRSLAESGPAEYDLS